MKINEIFDCVLSFIAVTLLSIVILGYFTSGFTLVAVSVIIGLCALALYFYSYRKHSKLKNREINESEVMRTLAFMGIDGATNYIKNALKKRYKVREEDGFFVCEKVSVYCFIRPRKLTVSDFADAYGTLCKAHKSNKKSILCAYGAEPDAIISANEYGVSLLGASDVFKLLSFVDALPTLKQKRKRKKFVITSIFNRKFARRYFLTATVLLLFATIAPYAVYYVAVACLLISLGFVCLLPKKSKMSR